MTREAVARHPEAPSPHATPGQEPWGCGLLALDKPAGVSSHDVVDKVRRRLRVKNAGHLGTLDPGASGLLLVATGPATRCIPVWQGGEKTYEATLRLGVVTSTQDLQGVVLEQHDVALDEAAVREAARALVGEIEQVPPMVSALKLHGQRLYRLARRGEVVERAPRRVRVSSWEWLSFSLPEAGFRVRCSSGTYVRTLAHDLGHRLGCGGALRSLRRLRSEPFGLEHSVLLRQLDVEAPEQVWEQGGYSLEQALSGRPTLALSASAAAEMGFGRQPVVARDAVAAAGVPLGGGPRSVVLCGPEGRVLGLGEVVTDPFGSDGARVRPHVVFPWAVRDGREWGGAFPGS